MISRRKFQDLFLNTLHRQVVTIHHRSLVAAETEQPENGHLKVSIDFLMIIGAHLALLFRLVTLTVVNLQFYPNLEPLVRLRCQLITFTFEVQTFAALLTYFLSMFSVFYCLLAVLRDVNTLEMLLFQIVLIYATVLVNYTLLVVTLFEALLITLLCTVYTELYRQLNKQKLAIKADLYTLTRLIAGHLRLTSLISRFNQQIVSKLPVGIFRALQLYYTEAGERCIIQYLFQALLMLYSAFVLLLLSKHYLDEGFFTRLIVDEQFCLEKKFVAEYVEMQSPLVKCCISTTTPTITTISRNLYRRLIVIRLQQYDGVLERKAEHGEHRRLANAETIVEEGDGETGTKRSQLAKDQPAIGRPRLLFSSSSWTASAVYDPNQLSHLPVGKAACPGDEHQAEEGVHAEGEDGGDVVVLLLGLLACLLTALMGEETAAADDGQHAEGEHGGEGQAEVGEDAPEVDGQRRQLLGNLLQAALFQTTLFSLHLFN
ncbi:hypothetical protein TYRP_014644 [Tyrophagus putrescentiae]|nr:hypothetical protein TYRP_014644 [Tyrophagus putrescentiae]